MRSAPSPIFRLYLRLVAAPPRRWRSALLRASTACTRANSAASTARRRVDTSLCTVDLLHPNARAAARTVALCSAMYSPSSAARCSGSTFIRSRLPLYCGLPKKYEPAAANMPAGA